MTGLNNRANFCIDCLRCRFAVVASLCHVAADEYFSAVSVAHCSDCVAETILGDHLSSNRSCLFEVIRCTGGWIFENDLFCNTATHRVCDLVEQLVSRNRVAVFERQHHGVTECATSRQNGDLGNRIAVVHGGSNQSVAGLVIGGVQTFAVLHQARLLLWPANYAVDGLVDCRGGDFLLVLAGGQKRCLVQHVG